MSARFAKFLALPLLAAALSAQVNPPEPAQDAADPSPKILPDTENSRATDTLLLGYRLADYARATKDARAMIVAARMIDSIPLKKGTDKGRLDREIVTEGAIDTLTAADLFAEAGRLAAGDPDLLAEIEASQAEQTRGVACPCNSIRTARFVPAKTTWTLRVTRRGGEPFVVGARRDSAVPVVLRVLDENGGLMCQDRSGNVTLYCRVNPIWTGTVSVQTVNYGEQGTGVALVSN